MGALLRCGLLVTLLILGSAESSGVFNFQVTRRGLDCAQAIIKTQLQIVPWNNLSGRTGDVSWELKNIRNRDASAFQPCLSFEPSHNKIFGLVAGVSFDFRADYKAKQQVGWFPVSSNGFVDVKFRGISADVSITLENGPDGQPSSVRSTTCSVDVGRVSLHFGGSWLSWLINLFKGALERRVRDEMKDQICDNVKNAISIQGRNTLSVLKDVSLEHYLCVNLQHCQQRSCLTLGF